MGRDSEFERNPGQLQELQTRLSDDGVRLFTVDAVLREATRYADRRISSAHLVGWQATRLIQSVQLSADDLFLVVSHSESEQDTPILPEAIYSDAANGWARLSSEIQREHSNIWIVTLNGFENRPQIWESLVAASKRGVLTKWILPHPALFDLFRGSEAKSHLPSHRKIDELYYRILRSMERSQVKVVEEFSTVPAVLTREALLLNPFSTFADMLKPDSPPMITFGAGSLVYQQFTKEARRLWGGVD